MPLPQRETDIEQQILVYLNAMPLLFAWKNKTTGVYDPSSNVFRKSNNKHVHKGVPDIIGIWKGRFFAIEVKTPKGKVSKDQEKFIQKIEDNDGMVIVARSLTDARNWFNKHKESIYDFKKVPGGLQKGSQGCIEQQPKKDSSSTSNGSR